MSRFNGQNRMSRRIEGSSGHQQRNCSIPYLWPRRTLKRQPQHHQNTPRNYYVPNQWAPRTEIPAGHFQDRGNRAHQAHGQTRTHRIDFEGIGNSSTLRVSAQPAEDPMALIQRLVSTGMLQLPSPSATPASNVSTSRHKQCSNCDRRFDVSLQSKEYQEHLDWHFKQNRQLKTAKKNFAGRVELAMKAAKPQQPSMKDTGVRQCNLCYEEFEQFFDQEEEEWRIRPAVRHNGQIVHPGCV